MRKIKIYITISTTIIFIGSLLTYNQAIPSTENQLTNREIALFLNDVHRSLDVIAQQSELILDQRYTHFSSARSSYFIGFAIGALGATGVARNAHIAAKASNINNLTMAGTTVVGAMTATAVAAAAPVLFVGSLTAAGAAAAAGVKYAAISATFATIAGFASSRSGKDNTLVANIDEATYMNSHYRMEMHYSFYPFYKFTKGLGSDVEGSCLLFFSIETWSPGYVINYEIDDCDHNEVFSQNQIGWNLRTGRYVDIIDRAAGQDKVVTSGQVKIRQL